MAIAYRAGATGGGGDASSITINKPTGTLDNDILIACLYREAAGAWTHPAGWSELYDAGSTDTGNPRLTVAWKRAASEGSNYQWTRTGSTWVIGAIAAFSGCLSTGSPIDVGAGNSCTGGAAHTPVAATITTTVANTMLVASLININGDNESVGSSGFSRGPYLSGTEIWYLAQAGAGASGAKTFGAISDYSHWVTYHLALKPYVEVGAASLVIPNPMRKLNHLLVR